MSIYTSIVHASHGMHSSQSVHAERLRDSDIRAIQLNDKISLMIIN